MTNLSTIIKTEKVIESIKELVHSKGYIYALCMIIFEDFHFNLEELQEIDHRERLSVKEASLLLGFLIQDKIDFTTPESPQDLIQMKQNTYKLMDELHQSFMGIFIEKLEKEAEKTHNMENYREEQKDFFGTGNMLKEPIFYSGTGVNDFQYLEFLDRKYKYDTKWLSKKKEFNLAETQKIAAHIKSILQEKSQKVHLYNLKKKLPGMIKKMKKKKPKEDWKKHVEDILPVMELHQYVELFFDHVKNEDNLTIDKMRVESWKSFYKSLIDLFIVNKSDFESNPNVDAFFKNFSIFPENNLNSQFQTIGDYNLINSHPIIKFDDDRYFVPIVFLLFEAIYESPFYWMIDDKRYKDQAGENRGKVGEEITYGLLSKVFGTNRAFKSVKIITKKGQEVTDIDVLCVLGSKALCVQVKSKKLTVLSRKGDDEALNNDFKGAVQDAYEQGLVSRQKILEKEATFINENGNEITLSEEIDDVYIMGITTENYPSLTHQAPVMLDKEKDNPFPIILTLFDLELLVHYLDDPYDFLYYVKQRTSLMDYFKADEEMSFLGFHLDQKLWKNPKKEKALFVIDNTFAKLIDRNYFPLKAGLEISDEGDVIKNRWKSEKFDQLCNELKNLDEPKITDILFSLFDWSEEARENLVNAIISTKQKTLDDGKFHNFSIPPDDNYSQRTGITYYSLNSDDSKELMKELITLCIARKYKSKGDIWIGFGGLKNSSNMIDIVAYNNHTWKYDKELEKASKILLGGKGQGQHIRRGKKIGRNEKCYCGSSLKYKRCCGRN